MSGLQGPRGRENSQHAFSQAWPLELRPLKDARTGIAPFHGRDLHCYLSNRGSTFALRRFILEFVLVGSKGNLPNRPFIGQTAALRYVSNFMCTSFAVGTRIAPCRALWVVRVGGDDGELRPWHYIYVYSIERI